MVFGGSAFIASQAVGPSGYGHRNPGGVPSASPAVGLRVRAAGPYCAYFNIAAPADRLDRGECGAVRSRLPPVIGLIPSRLALSR